MIQRQQPTHVRYEPHIDGGTTYAFSYRVGNLVVGRRPMWELVRFVEAHSCDLEGLTKAMVADDSPADSGGKYSDAVALLTDLTRLVDAGVLRVERREP